MPNADHTLSQTVKIKVKKLSQNQFPHQIQLLLFCNLWPLVFVIYKYYIIIIHNGHDQKKKNLLIILHWESALSQ